MKTVSIIGARPQFIKYAPLSKELKKTHQDALIDTGQHYDYRMNKIFFNELGIPEPDYNLGVGSGTHAYQTGQMLKGIADILERVNPDMVIVYGDTNSTIAGALSAAKLGIKVAHVEAGLRSFDKSMPEEINRVLTDHCSDYLFCPTGTAVDNLKREGVTKGVYLTGDVMVDALNFNKEIAERSNILGNLGLTNKQYLVVTVHRVSNTDIQENLEGIANALIRLCELGETILFPVHPRTMKVLKTYGLFNRLKEAVTLTEPLGYLEFLKVLNHAKKVLTDSGGIQKEAYILKVPCITLRENTEWVETVEDGWNILVGADTEKTVELARNFEPGHQYSEVFGQGACEKIAGIVNSF
jgi:UDP-N-acetylglucosamine 2-epimerase (non-hydrolysing)